MTRIVLGTRNTSRIPEYAGSTWVRLQYMLGLQKLGFEPIWVDRVEPLKTADDHRSLEYLVRRFHRMACDFGFGDRFCIDYNHGERYFGLNEAELTKVAGEAALLINVSGYLPDGSALLTIPRRAFVDVDPGFTQIWFHQWDLDISKHTAHFTVGQNVGSPGFSIPTRGIQWVPILPPVALDHWPATIDERCASFTTIADWRGNQRAFFEDQHYGGKRSEFMRILRLPADAKQSIEIALCIYPSDHEDIGLLWEHKWALLNPAQAVGDPHSYREFIQQSRAEISVAKAGYVRSNSGWISDRTACYLASGKPALVQSTGFESALPTGKGLLTFRDLPEAIAGVREINANYLNHAQAARALAEQYFGTDAVLAKVLAHVGL
jgi:hypothetical protein